MLSAGCLMLAHSNSAFDLTSVSSRGYTGCKYARHQHYVTCFEISHHAVRTALARSCMGAAETVLRVLRLAAKDGTGVVGDHRPFL